MAKVKQSQSVEDFLKAVYVLQQKADERVSTNALAEALHILPPSVTDMARRLATARLIDYKRYYGVKLTEAGEAIALRVIRRHRLIELYLVEELGYALREVHDEAESLEHAVSDRFITAIEEKLDHPSVDPHGDPIPAHDGSITRRDLISLNVLDLRKSAIVSRFTADGDEMLAHILDKGFKLGNEVKVNDRDPFDGPLTIELEGGETILLGHNVAGAIMVELVKA